MLTGAFPFGGPWTCDGVDTKDDQLVACPGSLLDPLLKWLMSVASGAAVALREGARGSSSAMTYRDVESAAIAGPPATSLEWIGFAPGAPGT